MSPSSAPLTRQVRNAVRISPGFLDIGIGISQALLHEIEPDKNPGSYSTPGFVSNGDIKILESTAGSDTKSPTCGDAFSHVWDRYR